MSSVAPYNVIILYPFYCKEVVYKPCQMSSQKKDKFTDNRTSDDGLQQGCTKIFLLPAASQFSISLMTIFTVFDITIQVVKWSSNFFQYWNHRNLIELGFDAEIVIS